MNRWHARLAELRALRAATAPVQNVQIVQKAIPVSTFEHFEQIEQTTKPTKPAAILAGGDKGAEVIQYDGDTPRKWSEALARLDRNKPPGDVPMRRWVRFLDDAHAFLASDWPRQAGELSWSALDLFGCHPVAPYARHDRRGLVWSFGECGGGRLVAMTGDTAVIERPTGSHQTFRRPVAAGDVVLPWELRE